MADLHANLPALEAAVRATHGLGIDRWICLGDLVGYNAQPRECLQVAREAFDVIVQGNHDRDVASGAAQSGTVSAARLVMSWTAGELQAAERQLLAELPTHVVLDGVIMAHGCYLNRDFYRGYVTSTMLPANLHAIAGRADWPNVALCGHTHVPMCGWLLDDDVVEHRLDQPLQWPARADAVLINPGAIGQPRDGDPRAAFAVVDLEARQVEPHRVEYDIARTAAAIAAAGLPGELAQRLTEGR